jgi:hypothetical protein
MNAILLAVTAKTSGVALAHGYLIGAIIAVFILRNFKMQNNDF